MFEQLINFSRFSDSLGIVWSVQGGRYLALQLSSEGEVIKQAEQPFCSFVQAQQWLKKQGISTISLRQTPAYFEMIGFSH
jgi:hypothetical protein